MNLAGVWTNHVVFVKRAGFDVSIERRLDEQNIFEFGQFVAGKLNVSKRNAASREAMKQTKVLVEGKGRKFQIRLTSNSVSERKGVPFYSLSPLHSGFGVDILREGDNDATYLVRFRPTKEAVDAGFGNMSFIEFCNGPARQIASSAKVELDLGESLAGRYPAILKGYPKSRGARYGLFLTDAFQQAFKIKFGKISPAGQDQLLERLKYCAAMHPDASIREPIAAAVLDTVAHDSVRGFLRLGNTSGRLQSLKRVATGGLINGMSFSIEKELEELKALQAAATASGANLEAIAGLMTKTIRYAPPSAIKSFIENIGGGAQAQQIEKKRLQEEALERNGPDLSQEELLLHATSKYFADNCNRAFLAIQTSKNDGDPTGVLLSRSVKAEGDECVVTTATHILRFSVREVLQPQCDGGSAQTCGFKVKWACKFDLNPDFGFSSSVGNVDLFCPVLRAVRVPMKGQFIRKSRRNWTAVNLEW